jgi:hypothetical protein
VRRYLGQVVGMHACKIIIIPLTSLGEIVLGISKSIIHSDASRAHATGDMGRMGTEIISACSYRDFYVLCGEHFVNQLSHMLFLCHAARSPADLQAQVGSV